jgi:hypothetical protein
VGWFDRFRRGAGMPASAGNSGAIEGDSHSTFMCRRTNIRALRNRRFDVRWAV